MTQQPRSQQFDERAALEELERLAERIQISRQQRAQAVEEFDAFVRGFRLENRLKAAQAAEAAASAPQTIEAPTSSPPARAAEPVRPQPEPQPQVAPPMPPPRPAIARPLSPGDRAFAAGMMADAPQADVEVPSRTAQVLQHLQHLLRQEWIRWAAAALALVVVLALMFLAGSPAPVSGPAQGSPPPAATETTPAATQAPAPAPVAPAAPPRALNVELVTVRPVWTRVTIDDRRLFERELPAGERLAFGADRTIGIRAGDAGAIRLVVDGKDQGVLGRDGQIAVRTFTAGGR